MRNIFILALICSCVTVYSQNYFADINNEVETWAHAINKPTIYEAAPPKSVEYSNNNYSITGHFAKGLLREGTIAKIFNTSSLIPSLLLEGKVSYQAGRLIIDGIRYCATSKGENTLYGKFYVYNTDDFMMNYKPKKAGALRVENAEILYVKGLYNDRPFIVSNNNGSTVYLDRKEDGNTFTFLSGAIPAIPIKDYDSFDIYQTLLQVKNDVTICWENGTIFNGVVKPTPVDGGLIAFKPLEGQRVRGNYKVRVSRQLGDIIYTQDYDTDNKVFSNETLYAKDDGTISEDDYWNITKILEHCYFAKRRYRDGNYYEGSIKYTVKLNPDSVTSSIVTAATKGVLKYPNGDRFEGDLSSKSLGQFFVDGTTYFSDGSKERGNWLGKYNLYDNQWEKITHCKTPSEAKALAQKFDHNNKFPAYNYSGDLTYFNPRDEKQRYVLCGGSYFVYDKAKQRYECKYSGTNKTHFIFAVDRKGQRTYEIVYQDEIPTYINRFTWYSNGVIESIKSYLYNTKELHLVCNFFSDGKLRSAYKYEKGNNAEIILRKSKESHPTYGGYTCKLYDLNGNYERTIEWGIGGGESLFDPDYIQKMAPEHIEFSQLKPIEITAN